MKNPAKNIIVTGASRGLGESICRQLSQLGHRVLATARNEEALRTLWGSDPNVQYFAADLAKPTAADEIIRTAIERFEQIDGLINNAGTIAPIGVLTDNPSADWAECIQVNLTAPALLMRAALPHLKKSGGRVVNISSGAAVKVVQAWSAYCASKAGLLHLSSVLAAENPEVAIFSLRPGVIDTKMQEQIRNSDGMQSADFEKFQNLHREAQLLPPEVPAASAVCLVLRGPLERSGEFIQHTDEELLREKELLLN